MLSGLNLAFFSVSKLQMELEATRNNTHARRVLALRRDSNFLLVTILWANVGVNVLLALLSNSVLAGVTAFLFSTVLITICGEIMPQAYFSRNALKMGSLLSPMIRLYQVILYPVAKPTALVLDKWLGPEAIGFFREQDLRELIKMHMNSGSTEIDKVEGKGSLNFLALDDLPVAAEGEVVDPQSILTMQFEGEMPVFPPIEPSRSDHFLKLLQSSKKTWVILVDLEGEPRLAVDAGSFLREAFFDPRNFNPLIHCHRPIIVRDPMTSLGSVIPKLKVHAERPDDDVVDKDIILYWGEEKHVITGSDILGRLLRGIVRREEAPDPDRAMSEKEQS
ncbi:hemolysin family protein [Desulfonatronum parangueonense]